MHEKLDYFDPLFIAALVMAAIGDFAFLFMLGLIIPFMGLVIAVFVLGIHYFVGLFIFGAVLFRLKHFVPKLILVTGIILPLPTLILGTIIAIMAQNRLVELLITQAALALTTAGAGNVVAGAAEGVSVAAKGIQAAKGFEAATELAEGGNALTKGTEAVEALGGRTRKLGGLRGKMQKGLEARVEDLEKEIAEENDVGEEAFGIFEPTDKMQELFEPDFKEVKNEDEEIKEPSQTSNWIKDPETGKEIYRPIDKANAQEEGLINLPDKKPEVDINDDTNEVNLKESA